MRRLIGAIWARPVPASARPPQRRIGLASNHPLGKRRGLFVSHQRKVGDLEVS
jgi:hypothetical protein